MTLYLATALVVLQVLDFTTTFVVLRRGGRELNIIVAKSMKIFGVFLGLLLTKSIGILAAILLWYLNQDIVLAVLVGIYSMTVWTNWQNYKLT